jgi:hypothetical protein
VEIPQTASMTFFAGQRSPQRVESSSSSSSHSHAPYQATTSTKNTSSLVSQQQQQVKPPAKTGSSRRKSPVKGVLEQQAFPNKVTMSPPMVPSKAIAALQKQKESLKKDICKKRSILEKDLFLDIRVRE